MIARSLKNLVKTLLWKTFPGLYRKVSALKGQKFSIGIVTFTKPFEFDNALNIKNPVLSYEQVTDIPAGFVADPFMLDLDGRWYMFFEVYNLLTRNGEIALATSTDGQVWSYEKVVLKESFHLAYPFVFKQDDEIYLIPDSPHADVRLYKAVGFPYEWEFCQTLVSGSHFSDSTVFFHRGAWWMLTGWVENLGDTMSLRLYSASHLTGTWHELPYSPLINNNNAIARPSGRVLDLDGKLIRFAQDGIVEYGSSVRAFEILEMTEEYYKEVELVASPVLVGSGEGWNADGMHHIDSHRLANGAWIACVDGWEYVDKHVKR